MLNLFGIALILVGAAATKPNKPNIVFFLTFVAAKATKVVLLTIAQR